jgi:hypothetical protein
MVFLLCSPETPGASRREAPGLTRSNPTRAGARVSHLREAPSTELVHSTQACGTPEFNSAGDLQGKSCMAADEPRPTGPAWKATSGSHRPFDDVPPIFEPGTHGNAKPRCPATHRSSQAGASKGLPLSQSSCGVTTRGGRRAGSSSWPPRRPSTSQPSRRGRNERGDRGRMPVCSAKPLAHSLSLGSRARADPDGCGSQELGLRRLDRGSVSERPAGCSFVSGWDRVDSRR